MIDKADYYINKIYEYRKYYGKPFNHGDYKIENIKDILNIIISRNEDCLLTDNYLDYLSSFPNFDYDLTELSKNIYGKMEMIKWYFETLDYKSFVDVDDKVHYYLSLSGDLKQKVRELHHYVEVIHSIGWHSDLVCKIIFYIYSYCYIMNRLDKANEICDSLLSDYNRLIDDTSLNDIWDGSHEWIDRIIGFCEDHIQSKRSIK